MAYLDVREPVAATAFTFAPVADADEVTGFAHHEWDIIELARNDGRGSLREPGRLTRMFHWLFGGNIIRRLADPRLETLRRLAVLSWHDGYAVPVSAIKSFKAAGFSSAQLELLLASIAAGRSSRSGRAHA
jgi:hypothetical protein